MLSRRLRNPERESIILQAVLDAAGDSGSERVEVRIADVYSAGVYIKDGEEKTLAYIDWGKDWGPKKISSHLLSLTETHPLTRRNSATVSNVVIENA